MSLQYTIARQANYIHIHAHGPRTREVLFKIASEALEECRRLEIESVLLDIRDMQPRLSVFDSTLLITKDLLGLEHKDILARLAIVDLPQNLQRLEFFQKLARARGINIGAFENPDKALRWVKEKQDLTAQ